MAAQEQQLERVVPLLDVLRQEVPQRGPLFPAPPRLDLPDLVDQPPGRGLDQPCLRAVRRTLLGPRQRRRQQRLLDGVLGRGEVAGPPDDRTEDLRRELTQQALDARRNVQRSPPACSRYVFISSAFAGPLSITWRTWIGCWVGTPPVPGTAEIFAAISSARSSDSTSTIE